MRFQGFKLRGRSGPGSVLNASDISIVLFLNQSLFYPEQRGASVQPSYVRQAPTIHHQPHRRRVWGSWDQPGGGGGSAVQSESCCPPAVVPAFPPQSLWALLFDRLILQAAAGRHHLRQPSAAQVENVSLQLRLRAVKFYFQFFCLCCVCIPVCFNQTMTSLFI